MVAEAKPLSPAPARDAIPLLELERVTVHFGGLCAVDALDLDVWAGELIGLIGPNGAGKTTFFNCITGIYSPTEGDIFITPPGGRQKRITGLNIHRVTESGVARTFQNIRIFPDMTVLENVMIGRHCRPFHFEAVNRSRQALSHLQTA